MFLYILLNGIHTESLWNQIHALHKLVNEAHSTGTFDHISAFFFFQSSYLMVLHKINQ